MRLPIRNLLKRQSQVLLAELQDEVCEIMYALCPNAILHGGTSIWRCFFGNRFSEDLDFYAEVGNSFEKGLFLESKKRGLEVLKFRKTKNNIFARVSNGKTQVSLEIANRKKAGAILAQYEKADGLFFNVFSLSREDILIEKVNAFLSRKLIRDIYDVYFLSSSIDLNKVKKDLLFLVSAPPEPVDEKNLKILLYSGAVPSFDQMLSVIRGRVL